MLSEALGDEHRRHPDRQGRELCLRICQARRPLRPGPARGGPPPLPRHRQARGPLPQRDRHRDRPRGPARRDRRRRPRGRHPRRGPRRRLRPRRHPRTRRGGNEFYSVAGAERLAEVLPTFTEGRALVGVCGAPFKCPPAPSEAALLLHDHLIARGVREDCEISFVLPLREPGPAFARDLGRAARGVRRARDRVHPGPAHRLAGPRRAVAVLDDGTELPYDLFLGVPKHRAPDVVLASGLTDDLYIPVDPRTLETRLPRGLRRRGRRHHRRPQGRASSPRAPPASSPTP